MSGVVCGSAKGVLRVRGGADSFLYGHTSKRGESVCRDGGGAEGLRKREWGWALKK